MRAIYKPFTEAFIERARAVKVGNGLEEGVEMGPVANHRRVEAMEMLVADAVSKGAKLLLGGERPRNSGYFYPADGPRRSCPAMPGSCARSRSARSR
jgi:succinate-semialdehyde dehydrogenase/glutarate-semialdehyde dehydrogenase